jgi:nanoRNase/pAp phosphatase (c-di-AMP/oligoRNAs hydrolase)
MCTLDGPMTTVVLAVLFVGIVADTLVYGFRLTRETKAMNAELERAARDHRPVRTLAELGILL